jgi:glycine dehydrogenase subunit 2
MNTPIKKKKDLIFDYSVHNKSAYRLPADFLPQLKLDALESIGLLKEDKPELPEVSEIEIVRHYTALSRQNFGVDTGFYPLGSCTMKYNPKINEDVARLDGFAKLHPFQDDSDCQGALELLHDLERYLCEIFGFSAFSLQQSAGAQGEYTGLLLMKAYHKDNGNEHKNIILVPDSSHGTNPASVTAVGWKIRTVKSKNGTVDLEDLELKLKDDVAGMMLTNPNTLGVFEKDITHICKIVHQKDALMYWDGANANAVMGYLKPAESGFDICHLNLHKTFSTPHGGGGPGSGPVGVVERLIGYLPTPKVVKVNDKYRLVQGGEKSVGRLHPFYGNVGILIRAYTYIRALGPKGLKEATENTVLLANYVKERLGKEYDIATKGLCKHEFVISLRRERKEYGVRALDVAKRLMDYGFHPPTIYFPLIVSEALMIETPETESLETIDEFIDAMLEIKKEMKKSPELLLNAPHTTELRRLDEVKAVKDPTICYRCH